MQKARAKTDAGRGLGPVSDHPAEALHRFDMGRVALDVSEQCRIIAGADAGEMRFQRRGQARRLWRQLGRVARVGEQLEAGVREKRLLFGQ